jgi:3D (Asp-Asp-Asp) domain-containing protein
MLKKIFILLFFTLSLNVFSQNNPFIFSINVPSDTTKLKKINLWATQYFIPQLNSSGNIPFIDQKGKALGLYADTCSFCEARLEGTVYVKDSSGKVTVLNFAGTGERSLVDCRKCKRFLNSKLDIESWGKTVWSVSEKFGNGVKNYSLLPYRTIAVDPKMIPYGTVIFIPSIRGKIILLPDGTKSAHDGYFFAGDTGSAIHKNHIDIFTGIVSENPFPETIQSNEKKIFNACIITDQKIIQTVTSWHIK